MYPASGHRHRDSGVFNNTGSVGDYWSCVASGVNGYNLYFYSAFVNPSSNPSRAFGFPVRCVQYLLLLSKRIFRHTFDRSCINYD